MDGFTEKKWFVYLGDHHEGPFSLSEIQSKMNYGQLTATNYVWADGMADWTLMSDVRAFESIITVPIAPAPMATAVQAVPVTETVAIAEAVMIAEPVLESPQVFDPGVSLAPSGFSPNAGPILSAAREPLHEAREFNVESPAPRIDHSSHKKALAGQFIKIGFLFILLGGIGFAYNEGYLQPLLNSQSVKSTLDSLSGAADPILSKLGFSPIPKLDDVSPEDYAQLKAAAQASLDQGPKIAVVLSKADPFNPVFYVASNLADGTMLDLYIDGIPETLLNQLSFSAKTSVTITKKFGKSGPTQFSQGKSFPRGEYQVSIVDPGPQPQAVAPLIARMPNVTSQLQYSSVPKGLHIVAMKQYFLGGARDAIYTARLKEFHDKVAAQAQQELTELKQIGMTLDGQLNATNDKFKALGHGKRVSAAQKRAWNQFDGDWTKFSAQLGQIFAKLTPDSVRNDYFYGPLYQLGKQTSDAVEQLHALQTTYFTRTAGATWDSKAFAIQIGESQAAAKSAEDMLNARIDQVEKLPPSAGGLPQRIAE